ncbi:hypothetical protein Tco_1091529 [Tanacetum coccineum]|uniref:Uncharacterized protein n=1 Tax=Tanacetum coccineum TaxID=301880 RepID=A0ABQ5I8G3_9ASTR
MSLVLKAQVATLDEGTGSEKDADISSEIVFDEEVLSEIFRDSFYDWEKFIYITSLLSSTPLLPFRCVVPDFGGDTGRCKAVCSGSAALNKSPGLMGIHFELFRKYWTFIGNDFIQDVKEFFDNAFASLDGSNSSIIASF